MVLLVIDAQKLITTEKLYMYKTFIYNVKTLIETARNSSIEVIFVRHDDGENQPLSKENEGFEIYDKFSPLSNEKIYDKFVNSPFKESGLLDYLKSKNEHTLIITGLQTDYCIDAAVKCGFEHGFEILIPEYSNSTFDNNFMTAEESYNYYNKFIWNGRYGKYISFTDMINMMKNPLNES